MNETLSTLRYADRARKIKNKPIVNQDSKIAEINRLNKIVQELRLALINQELGITCPKEHEELEEKYSTLQQKFRDMTEKLNLNLGEIVVMHERAEMAEQAREKIRSSMATLLDEFNQILQDLNDCPEINNERYNILKAIYEKMLGKYFSLCKYYINRFKQSFSHIIFVIFNLILISSTQISKMMKEKHLKNLLIMKYLILKTV